MIDTESDDNPDTGKRHNTDAKKSKILFIQKSSPM